MLTQDKRVGAQWKLSLVVVIVTCSLPAAAQFGGPRSTTTIGGHSLAPAPSVTSVGGSHLPPPAPSVTSLPNFGGYNYHYRPYFSGRSRGYGYWPGWSYAVPYYYPADNSIYGYDYVGNGGPDLYSGPPPGPNDPILHVIVEQPPANPYGPPPDRESYAAPAAPPAPSAAAPAEVKPGEPTLLVFRNGHKQEVTNYAIMGETLYVFDQGRKKIALADLDIPATVKANDDRGMEFRVPPSPAKKKTAPAPQSATPDHTADAQPPNIAALTP